MRKALDETQEQLRERRNIEKAKLLLIQQHAMNEERAHQFLRDQAMQRRLSLGAMAMTIIEKLEAADSKGVAKK